MPHSLVVETVPVGLSDFDCGSIIVLISTPPVLLSCAAFACFVRVKKKKRVVDFVR
jgi:hypothetical protein